jgi:hypothetical protein
LAAAELGRPALAETALKQHRRPEIVSLSADLGIPKNTRAALPKISIRSKIRQIHFILFFFIEYL